MHPYEQGMLKIINRAKLVALLIAVRHCRPGVKESVATASKCSLQKFGMHRHRQTSATGRCSKRSRTRSCNEHKQGMREPCSKSNRIEAYTALMADKLANEAADECCISRHMKTTGSIHVQKGKQTKSA